MALHIYRFRLQTPGVSETQLESEVGITVSLPDYAGGVIVDVECDDSHAQDLFDAMASRGYEFVEGDPTTAAVERFRSENSIVGVEQHKALRQLIHFVETNSPGDGFGPGPYVCKDNQIDNVFPVDETWYEDATLAKRICRWEGVYNPNKTWATKKWIVYKEDGVNPAAEATDVYTYSGIVRTERVRTIVVY